LKKKFWILEGKERREKEKLERKILEEREREKIEREDEEKKEIVTTFLSGVEPDIEMNFSLENPCEDEFEEKSL